MPALRPNNPRYERLAQAIIETPPNTRGRWKLIAEKSGYANRSNACKAASRPEVVARVAELRAQVAEKVIAKVARTSADVIQKLWDGVDRMEAIAASKDKGITESVKVSAQNAAKGQLELLGRHYRSWDADDGADASADHIPLHERLKAYERDKAIDTAPNVERLKRDGTR